MKKRLQNTTVLLLTLAILSPVTVYAFGRGKDRPKGPPPEAIEACAGKSAGTSVVFTDRRGESLEAVCREKNGLLAAVPNKKPKGGDHQGPPLEAIEACAGKTVGDSVVFTDGRGESLEATCQERDGQMAAVPDNMPEGEPH